MVSLFGCLDLLWNELKKQFGGNRLFTTHDLILYGITVSSQLLVFQLPMRRMLMATGNTCLVWLMIRTRYLKLPWCD